MKRAKRGCGLETKRQPQGEAEGREQSRKIRRQREAGGLGEGEEGGDTERGKEWVGWVSVSGWLGIWGSGTPWGEKRKAGSPGGTGSHREEREELREGPGTGKGVAQRPPRDGRCSQSERPSSAGTLGCTGGGR